MTTPTTLHPDQIAQFLDQGYLRVSNCFSREAAEAVTDQAFVRLGYDKDKSSTWTEPRVHMPSLNYFECKTFAPAAWAAACDLLGGEERIQQPCNWGDALIANFHEGLDRPWKGPSAQSPGWHKDGDFFRHFLDSPEQGLLVLVLWSDIATQGGGTFVAPDSIAPLARFFASRPDGVLPNEIPFRELIGQCHEFEECTGSTGDVFLCHPFLLHTVSQNHGGKARFITNPPVSLKEPMDFNRDDLNGFSPVEQAILNGLGVERLDFQPTVPRERIVPDRVKREQAVIETERKRLAAAT
ncbi:MAG: hypothetical protein ACRYFS_22475 [Janthinobacterium lividum]